MTCWRAKLAETSRAVRRPETVIVGIVFNAPVPLTDQEREEQIACAEDLEQLHQARVDSREVIPRRVERVGAR